MMSSTKRIAPAAVPFGAMLICLSTVWSQTGPAPAIWKPKLETSWQWQLTTPVDLGVEAEMYDIDLFDNSASVVEALHARGRKVVCYVSVGTFEPFRSDAARFPAAVKGKPLEDFPNERWLDIRRWDLLGPIIEARLDLCKSKGFDGVEPDNVDGFENDSGFPLAPADQIVFNERVAAAAHARGLSVGLKNDVEQARELAPSFDWALNEQCFQYRECGNLNWFTQAGKAVFQVEYELTPEKFCPQANTLNFNSLRKNYDLDNYRVACREATPAAPARTEIKSVLNGASFRPGISPGMIVSIAGSALGPPAGRGSRSTTPGLIDAVLDDTRVVIDGQAAPLLYLGAQQILAMVPYAVSGKPTVQVQLASGGALSAAVEVPVQPASPGIFTVGGYGAGQAAAVNEYGLPNSTGAPATRGSIVTFYATGEGLLSPLPADGQISKEPYPAPLLAVAVRIGGLSAPVVYAGSAPLALTGMLQVKARIPLDALTGSAVPLELVVGGQSSQAGVTIAIAP